MDMSLQIAFFRDDKTLKIKWDYIKIKVKVKMILTDVYPNRRQRVGQSNPMLINENINVFKGIYQKGCYIFSLATDHIF